MIEQMIDGFLSLDLKTACSAHRGTGTFILSASNAKGERNRLKLHVSQIATCNVEVLTKRCVVDTGVFTAMGERMGERGTNVYEREISKGTSLEIVILWGRGIRLVSREDEHRCPPPLFSVSDSLFSFTCSMW